jgi:protein-tyrosine-phosphatase
MMHFTFRETVSDQTDIDSWMLSSRGTRLGHDSVICKVADRMLRGHPGADRFAHVHRARSLVAKHLEEQDLIVVATVQERGRIARLSPGDRSRVFTLREATMLGSAAPTRAELKQAAALLSVDWNTPARAFAKLLSERRGLVTSPSGNWLARGLVRLPNSDPLDIADGHHRGILQHTLTLRRVQAETECLADQMLRFLDALG